MRGRYPLLTFLAVLASDPLFVVSQALLFSVFSVTSEVNKELCLR
jgi:hypothetical protein